MACMVGGAFWFADFAVKFSPALKRFSLDERMLKIAGSILMIGASIPLLANNYGTPKQGFESTVSYIEQAQLPEDKVMTVGLAELPFGGYLTPDWPHLSSFAEFEAATGGAETVWVVVAFPSHLTATYPEIAAGLAANYEIVERFSGTLSGGDVLIYRRLAL